METPKGRTEVMGMSEGLGNCRVVRAKVLCLAAGIALLILGPGWADLPGLRAPLPDTPATLSQFRAHLPGSGTTGPAANDPEIQALAQGLNHDPGLMYKFVHDHIHFTPTWGEVKGPYMTWMDRSGNAFDQASLMIALLTNADGHGHTITHIKYQVGEITVNGEQFAKWLDINNSAEGARRLLARGGFYGEVTNGQAGYIGLVQFVHVWVKATIDGKDYEFDPSFKSHTDYDGCDWTSSFVLGYDKGIFLADARRAGGGYNTTNIRNHLTAYTNNLISDIKTNHPNDDLRELIGGASIDPVKETAMPPTTLPYQVDYRHPDFAIGSIPNIYRTTLRIRHEGIDWTLYSSDVYGRRLSLMYNGSVQPQLFLDGAELQTSTTALTRGNVYDVNLAVDHPYETTSFDGAVKLKVKAGGFYHIANGWGDTGTKILLKHRGLLQKYRLDGFSDSSEEVLGESYALVGLTYLAKISRSRYLAGRDDISVNHHLIGVAGQYDAPYLDMALGHLALMYRGGWEAVGDMIPAFDALAGHASVFEQEVLRQMQGANAVSTPRVLEMANDQSTYNRIFTATDANWASVQSQLRPLTWSPEEIDQVDQYVDAGYTVGLPEDGNLAQDAWTGMGFRATKFTDTMLAAAYVLGSYKGATGCATATPVNLAVGKPMTASTAYAGLPASNATDGDTGTRWSSQFSDNEWIYVDLGATWTINRIVLRWEAAYGRGYKLQVSDNANDWSDVYTTTTGNGGVDDVTLGSPASGRYVRMLGAQRATEWGYSLWEFEVYGVPPNLALGRPAIASTTYPGLPALNVTDGDTGTRWSSQFSDDQWIYVDLGSTCTVKRIVLRWETAYGRGYKLQVSDNANDWSDVYTTTTGNGGVDDITLGSPVSGRYVRMLGTQRRTEWGYSLWEFEVYSDVEGSVLGPATVLDHSFGASSDGDPEGAYTTGATDITIGHGGFPFGLAFGRQYSSQRRHKDGPLGLGWTHNYDIGARVLSDSFQTLATESAINAAAHLVCRHVTRDILLNGDDSRRTIANLCESWLMDQMKDNVVEIKQGSGVLRFTKKSDGTYNPPSGQALKLTQVSGNWRLKNSKGIFYDFDSRGKLDQWSDAHGNVVDFLYDSGTNNLSRVECRIGGSAASWFLAFTYDGNHITSVTDSAGRHIWYTYNASTGELEKYRNPDYVQGQHEPEVKYEYDPNSKGLLNKIYSPVDLVHPFVTIGYDMIGRMVQQTDADGGVWDFHRATYRNEVLPPAQVDTNGVSGRFGSASWANPDTRQVISKDAMGRKTTSTYDAQARTESAVGPAGTAAAFTYDENHNVLTADSLAIAGSAHEDPNVYRKYGYDTHENAQGRWFVHQIKQTQIQQTGVTGPITLFYYDYNNVGAYGTELGRLMKAISLPDNPSVDANEPNVCYTYNTYGQVETQIDPNGMVTRFVYDDAAHGAGLQQTIIDDGGLHLTTGLTYDSVGRVATTTNPRGKITTNEYYPSGLLQKTIPPAPFNTPEYQTCYEYDLAGRLTFVKQGTVVLQEITYNNRGLKESVRGPYPESHTEEQYAVNYTRYAYDALGRLWKVTDAENHVTETRYWADGKVWKVIDAKGNDTATYRYYGNGSVKDVNDANGNTTRYEYNGFMGLAKTTYPDNTYEGVVYDEYRRVKKNWGRSGQRVELTYDGFGRVKKKETYNPDNATIDTIHYQYDLLGRLYKTDHQPLGVALQTTKNTYDKAGRLKRVEYPGGKTVSYDYDGAGNRTWLKYPDGMEIAYEYDELNRLTYVKELRDQSSTTLASYNYDSRSRRTNLTYPNGAYANYNYDPASRLLFVDNQTANGQHKYAYTYDKVGNRQDMTVTDSGGTRMHVYTYDSIYQVTGVDYPSGFDPDLATDTTFHYDAAGNRSSVIDGSGTYTYTANNLNQYTAAGMTSFQYDDSGNMTADGTCNYFYDPENRLIRLTKSGSAPTWTLGQALDSGLTFTTGGAANWTVTSGTSHEGLWSARSGNITTSGQESYLQTQVEGEGTATFWWKVSGGEGHDYLEFWVDGVLQEGRISGSVDWTEMSYPVSGAGTHTLRWRYVKTWSGSTGDNCGWVDWVQWSGSCPPVPEPALDNWTTLLYRYDAAGRRVDKLYNYETITKYVYDGDHCIAEYDVSNGLRRKYIYGPGVDEPISMIEAAGMYAGTYYYHFDGLGSVVGLTNASGDTVEVYEYDVYGRPGATDAGHPNRFMFTGREYDKETGLYYYRARYYNPQIGRFLQTDPAGYEAGMNWYAYCGNNSINGVDPDGLQTIYVYHEVEEGLSFFYMLTEAADGTEWNLAGIASWQHVDPSQVQATDRFGPGTTGYVIRGRSTGYSDPAGTMGDAEMLGADPSYGDPASDGAGARMFSGAQDSMRQVSTGFSDEYAMSEQIDNPVAGTAALMGLLRSLGIGRGGWVMHHTVPTEILNSLPERDVANDPLVRGIKGAPNRWKIPEKLHRKIHSGGPRGGEYNEFWRQEIQAIRETRRSLTVQDVLRIRAEAVARFHLKPYAPLRPYAPH